MKAKPRKGPKVYFIDFGEIYSGRVKYCENDYCMVESEEFNDIVYKHSIRPHTPEGLKELKDILVNERLEKIESFQEQEQFLYEEIDLIKRGFYEKV